MLVLDKLSALITRNRLRASDVEGFTRDSLNIEVVHFKSVVDALGIIFAVFQPVETGSIGCNRGIVLSARELWYVDLLWDFWRLMNIFLV